ncbi:MAG: hypothetical protein JWL64_2291, partial [Frankiales bacterium]|nr:hypothetical protein [Frankiales bacterium]
MQSVQDLPLDGVALLALAVQTLQTEDPAGFSPAEGLARTGRVLSLLERARPVALAAVHDLDQRELYALDGCGSARGWLRTQTCGDGGQLAAARRLSRRPVVREAAEAGLIGRPATDQLCGALTEIDRLATADPFGPGPVSDPITEDQIIGLLAHGIPDLLRDWLGTGLDVVDLTEAHLDRREQLARVLTDAANNTLAAPADRLAPVLVLLATALPPADLPGA